MFCCVRTSPDASRSSGVARNTAMSEWRKYHSTLSLGVESTPGGWGSLPTCTARNPRGSRRSAAVQRPFPRTPRSSSKQSWAYRRARDERKPQPASVCACDSRSRPRQAGGRPGGGGDRRGPVQELGTLAETSPARHALPRRFHQRLLEDAPTRLELPCFRFESGLLTMGGAGSNGRPTACKARRPAAV
jgi:hypothetical protein